MLGRNEIDDGPAFFLALTLLQQRPWYRCAVSWFNLFKRGAVHLIQLLHEFFVLQCLVLESDGRLPVLDALDAVLHGLL